MEGRGVADSDERTLRAQQSSRDLGPRLRLGIVDELVALGREFGGPGSDRHFELDAGLGDRNLAGHSAAPKQAFAASERGHKPKCLVLSSLWVKTSRTIGATLATNWTSIGLHLLETPFVRLCPLYPVDPRRRPEQGDASGGVPSA